MLHSPDFIVFLTALGIATATPGPGLAAIVATTSMVLALSAAVVVVLSLVFCIYVFFALRVRAVLSRHQSSGRMNRLTSIVLA